MQPLFWNHQVVSKKREFITGISMDDACWFCVWYARTLIRIPTELCTSIGWCWLQKHLMKLFPSLMENAKGILCLEEGTFE